MPSRPDSTSCLSRRDLLQLAAATAAWSTLGGSAGAQPGSGRPNVLFLMSDQHRGDCIAADGHPSIQTPHLDRLAGEGARFRCAYTSTPSCTPARSGILTGMSPWGHGMLGYGRVAEKYPNELPRLMREAGYYTLGIGKMHWSPQRNLHGFHMTILDESSRVQSVDFRSDYRSWFYTEAPASDPDATGIGFNDYRAKAYVLPERLHPTRWTGDTAVHFLEHYARPEPFFLKVSFARPHSPYDPPQRLMDKYRDAEIPPASLGAWAERHAKRGEPHSDSPWEGDFGAAQVRHSRQGYYGSVSFVDEQVGRILDVLERRGMLENTLILYTSDHGDMTGDHNLWRKCYAYEPSARIPMLVRWGADHSSARRGQILEQPVELRDLLPTFVDAAGAGLDPRRFEGRSLLDLVEGQGGGWRKFIDLEHDVCYSPDNHWSALTDGRTKYIFHARDGEQQLFDLEHDPGEKVDLSSDPSHAAALRTWRGRMIDHLSVRGAPFVKGGDLALRPERHLYGKNYPGEVG